MSDSETGPRRRLIQGIGPNLQRSTSNGKTPGRRPRRRSWESWNIPTEPFVERWLSMLASHGRVLEVACGPGKNFPMVLGGGRWLLGVDHPCWRPWRPDRGTA